MRNILHHGPRFAAFLLFLPALVFVASLFWHIGPAPAQEQVFTYKGQPFDPSQCSSGPTVTCVGGSVSGSVTFDGLSSSYTGGVSTGQMSSLGFIVDGLTPTLGLSDPGGTISINMTGGVITDWSLNFTRNSSDPQYQINTAGSVFGGGDFGLLQYNSPLHGYLGRNGVIGHWTSQKSFGLACNAYHSGAGSCGEPIDLGSGNVFDQVTDYETAGQNKLSLIRYYNSMETTGTSATSMGVNWRTNYDRFLHVYSHGVVAERPDGQQIGFTSSSGTYTPDSDIDLKLANPSGSTWTLTDRDDTVETYTVASGLGTLNSIKARNGYTQALTYSHSQIAFVSDSYTRQLTLGYSSGLLATVSTPEFTSGLTYGYVAFGSAGTHLLSTVTYNTSPATHQTYLYENANYPYALTGITDENGNRYATWGYDSAGRGILSQLSGAVNYTSVYYNDTTGNRVVKGPLGIVETYKFSTLQGVPKVTEIDRAANGSVAFASQGFAYDSNGYTKSKTDWNRNITAWTNNIHGLPTQIVYASTTTNAQTTNLTYDLSWPHLPHTIAANGVTANFTYDSSGNNLIRKLTDTTSTTLPYSTNGTTRTWTYTYNRTGEVLTAQLPRTDVTAKTTYAYTGGTSGGTLIKITDALSHVTTVNTATGGGRPKKITDPNSRHTTLSWTPRNWLSSSVLATSAGNLTTSFTYDSAGNLTKSTLPDNSYLSYGYDNAHRPNSITNALSESASITYDSAGDVTQMLWKNASSVTKRQHTATYDVLGRTLTDVGGQSQTTSYRYDNNGNVQKITDPLSHITYISADQLNRPYRYKGAALDISTIKYDSHSRPLTVTDPRGRQTTFVYDGFGDTIQQNSPDTLKTIYYYDPDSNMTGQNQSGINFSSATYDALDRLLTRTYSADATLNVSITYDQAGHGDGIGRLTSLTDQVGSLSRSYDERANVTTDARTITGQLYSNAYTYESAGRLSSITYASSGWLVTYTRDSAGQISSVTDKQPGHTAVNLATSVTHMPFGPASSWTYGNGVTDTRTFDLDYRMTSVTDHGAANIQYLSYGYDADNNVTSNTDHVTPADNQTFHYDLLSRISYASGPYGTVSSITYDSNSNRLAYGATTYTIPGLSNRMSKVGASSISYISTGNISAIAAAPFTYYKSNQLATAKPATATSTFWYDAFGSRLKVKLATAGNPFRVEIYDLNGHLLTQTSGSSIVETDYAWLDDMPLYVIAPAAATISALHTDNVGTVQRATNAAKTVVWTGNYDPNGAVTPTTSILMNLRQLGVLSDVSGDYHNGFRDRVPGTIPGYLQSDPLGIAPWLLSPTSGNPNTYPWLGYNPYKNTDPTGQFVLLDNALGGLIATGVDVAAQWGHALVTGQPFRLDKTRTAVAFGAGFATDGVSAVFGNSVTRLGLGASSTFALRTAGRAAISVNAALATTALLNKLECSDDSLLTAALYSAAFGILGSAVQDGIAAAGPAVAKFDPNNLFAPNPAFANKASVLGGAVGDASSFFGGPSPSNSGGASCTCSH